MGGLFAKKGGLSKEDMQFLIDNTNFDKKQIKQWYKGFMVSQSNFFPDWRLPNPFMLGIPPWKGLPAKKSEAVFGHYMRK